MPEPAFPIENLTPQEAPAEKPRHLEVVKKESLEERAKNRIVRFLEENDILKEKEDVKVFDLEKFLSSELFEARSSMRRNPLAKNSQGEQKFLSKERVFETLRDWKVVSRKDFEEAQKTGHNPEAIPLFNIPESADEAFDLETIKDKRYYLNYWDLHNKNQDFRVDWSYEIEVENGEKITAEELALATEIFRNHQGQRSENGKLLVFDKREKRLVPLSTQWIKHHLGSLGRPDNPNSLGRSPQRFLANRCPHILKEGLITQADFRGRTDDKGQGPLRKETLKTDKLEIMLDGVKYFLGRENFIFKDLKVPTENIGIIQLDSQTAGIIDKSSGEDRLILTLRLLSPEEKEAKRKKIAEDKPGFSPSQISARTYIGKKEIEERLEPWSIEESNPQRSNETQEDYRKRIEAISNFQNIRKVSQDFSEKCSLGIHKLSWQEQQWLAGFASQTENYQALIEFGKKYKLPGLRTFFSTEFGFDMGEKILALGEKLPPETANAIFEKYAEIVDATGEVEKYLRENLKKGADSEETIQGIQKNLLTRAKDLLEYFSENMKRFTPEDILSRLSGIKSEVILLASTFEEIKKNYPNFSLEEAKNLNLTDAPATKISSADKESMLEIFLANRQDNPEYTPELLNKVRTEFEKAFQNPLSTFYILKDKVEIISFIRFDQIDDATLYAASFNVRNEGRRSGIGKAMMKKVLDEKAKSHNLLAIALSTNPALRMYLDDFGFEIIGSKDNYEGTGKTFHKLFRRQEEGEDRLAKAA